MEYRELCEDTARTRCRRLSRIIIGTDHLGKLANESDTWALLAEAVRMGSNAIDTAPIYINSEWRLGRWLHDERALRAQNRFFGGLFVLAGTALAVSSRPH